MSDAPSKFLKFLDQLLPFLATSPPWLRIWVHGLILLNFLTIAGLAVYYLSSKEKGIEEQSLGHFSIDVPLNNQETPLGDSGTLMVSGTLPKAKGADVDLQVLKLPDRIAIPQNAPQKTISTFDGHWRFETAKFAGYGAYEIKATASLEGETRVIYVTVTCYDKATAYRLSIEREQKFRTSANIMELPSAAVSLGRIKQQFIQLQNDFFASYPKQQPTDDDLQHSLAIVNQGLDLLDSVLPLWPNDADLQNGRAFFLKDYAMVTRDLERLEVSKKALEEAQVMFEALREQQPTDTNAWNGLGSVFLLNGQPEKALVYIEKALELEKDNPYAQQDRNTAIQMIKERRAATAR